MKKVFLPLLCALLLLLPHPAAAASGFTDVPAGSAYATAVEWCFQKGILNGVSATSFAPDATLTRAMAATALWRAAGKPAVTGVPGFDDTAGGVWYSDAVVWANEKGIIKGYGDGRFGTQDAVTQEQLDVMLQRYAGGHPVWTGDRSRAIPCARWEVATALYDYFHPKEEPRVTKLNVSFNSHSYTATLAQNSSVDAFVRLLREKGGSLTLQAQDYGDFEKVASLGAQLPTNNQPINTVPGDIILYQGDKVCLYYAVNSWTFTQLGKLDGDLADLRADLGTGDVSITYSLP